MRPFKIVLVSMAELGHPYSFGTSAVGASALSVQKARGRKIVLAMRDDLDRVVHTPEEVAQAILAEKPDLVGFGIYAWNAHVARPAAALLRLAGSTAVIVAGGPWPFRQGERFLLDNPSFDVLVQGPGEVPFAEIVARLVAGSSTEALAGIPGTTVAVAGSLRPTPPARFDPNGLPSPYRMGLMNPNGHMALALRRGCSARCTYCAWGEPLSALMSQETIDAELAWGAGNEIGSLYLTDAALNRDIEDLRIVECAARRFLETAGRPLGVNGSFDVRFCQPDRLDLMKRTKYASVVFGLQTTNPQSLKTIRRTFDRDAFSRVIDSFRQDTDVIVDLMLGLPGDDPEGFRRSLDYAISLGVRVAVYLLVGLPGSEMDARRDAYGMEFNRDGIPYLLKSATFSPEDLRDAAAYFVSRCPRKTSISDFSPGSPLFPRNEYNYWVPARHYHDASQRFGEPLPPALAVPGSGRPPPPRPAGSASPREARAVITGEDVTDSRPPAPAAVPEPPTPERPFPYAQCVTCVKLDACTATGPVPADYPSCRAPITAVEPRALRRLISWWTAHHSFDDRRLARVGRSLAERCGRDEGRFSEVFEPSYSRDAAGDHYFRFSYAFPGHRSEPAELVRDFEAFSTPFGADVRRWVRSLAERAAHPCVSHPLFGIAYDGADSWRLKVYLQFRDDAQEQAAALTEKIAGPSILRVLPMGELHMLGVDLGSHGIAGLKFYLRHPSVPLDRPPRSLSSFAGIALLRDAGITQIADLLEIHRMRRPDDPDVGIPADIDFPLAPNELRWSDLATTPALGTLMPVAAGFARLAEAVRTAVRRVSLSGDGSRTTLYYVPTGPVGRARRTVRPRRRMQ